GRTIPIVSGARASSRRSVTIERETPASRASSATSASRLVQRIGLARIERARHIAVMILSNKETDPMSQTARSQKAIRTVIGEVGAVADIAAIGTAITGTVTAIAD